MLEQGARQEQQMTRQGHKTNQTGRQEHIPSHIKTVTEGVRIRGRPIIGADIKHFYDYRYWPFSKQICR